MKDSTMSKLSNVAGSPCNELNKRQASWTIVDYFPICRAFYNESDFPIYLRHYQNAFNP